VTSNRRRVRVVVVSVQGQTSIPAPARRSIEAVADVTYVARPDRLSPGDARRVLRDADIVAVTPKVAPRFDRDLLRSLPRLRGLALYATGYDLLDLDLLSRHGVRVCSLPHYSTEAVAQHALALLLALACRVHLANDRSRGLVPDTVSLRGFELAGRSLGVIGFGRIGRRVAALAAGAFQMPVLAYDRRWHTVAPASPAPGSTPATTVTSSSHGSPITVARVDLHGLLDACDTLVLCCSRDPGAPPVLGPAELRHIRHGAVLVNVGRPELVDHQALVPLLRSGKLRGYAVDDVVFGPGDGEVHTDLLREGRVLQTGHSAWWRDEVLERGGRMWAEVIRRLALDDPVDVVGFAVPAEKAAG
jgi:lactate dehydrogenase-like 2-hydroxyacid dehydrogenase